MVVVVFCWVPGHAAIRGNIKADAAAKAALDKYVTQMKLPYTDLKQGINVYIRRLWQIAWDLQIDNKLHSIRPRVGTNVLPCLSRREEVVLSRLRIGHTFLTHCFLLKSEPRPECVPCQCPLTVKHLLLECEDTALVRDRYFQANTLRELFDNESHGTVLDFLREVQLYDKM